MIKAKKLLEFATEMSRTLDEKSKKYEGDYDTIGKHSLFKSVEDQIIKYKDNWWNEGNISQRSIPYKKRRLVHIANFCLLLWCKLQEELEEYERKEI